MENRMRNFKGMNIANRVRYKHLSSTEKINENDNLLNYEQVLREKERILNILLLGKSSSKEVTQPHGKTGIDC